MLSHAKTLIISSIILGSLSLAGCGSEDIKGTGGSKQETRSIGDFSGININGNYSIMGDTGSPNKLVISSNPNVLPHIESYVDDDTLIIKYEKGMNIKASVQQNVWFTSSKINHIDLSGQSQAQLTKIKSDKLDCNFSGSHQLALQGQTTDLKIVSKGSINFNAKELKAKNADIEINGSGVVAINVTDNLKVKINGDAQVVYYGGQPKVEQIIQGSGRVGSSFQASDANG